MLRSGQIFDRYKVQRAVAEGTTAWVYEVLHVWLHVPMALKHLHEGSDISLHYALLEEARIGCLQSHENLVSVHDALEIEDRPALVMEWIDGPDLAKWMDASEQVEMPVLKSLIGGLCSGLGYAHEQGIVHRDLKPENIFLKRTHRGLVPKVGDFGMAKILNKDAASFTLSGTYENIGTPEYMAPEQIGDPGLVDHRADLFAVGCLVYELWTGTVAFDAPDEHQAFERVLSGDRKPMLEFRPDTPPALMELVDALLDKEPDRRPPDCRSIRRALHRIS